MSNAREKALIVGINSILGVSIAEKLKTHFDVHGIHHIQKDRIPSFVLSKPVEELHEFDDVYTVVCFVSAYIPTNQNINQEALFATNVRLLENVIKQFPTARIVHASSVSVYGVMTQTVNEHAVQNEVSAYGLSKLWAEKIVSACDSYAILRISSMFGPGMKRNTFLPLIIQNALQKKEIVIYGDGSRKQDYIHVDDVAACFYAAARSVENGVFLAVSGTSYSNIEIARELQKMISDVRIEHQGSDPVFSSSFDGAETRSRLHWRSEKNVVESLLELIQWIKGQY